MMITNTHIELNLPNNLFVLNNKLGLEKLKDLCDLLTEFNYATGFFFGRIEIDSDQNRYCLPYMRIGMSIGRFSSDLRRKNFTENRTKFTKPNRTTELHQ